MKIMVVGSGYVGPVTAACLAAVGNSVVSYDKNLDKITRLDSGDLPIYEPGLAELIHRNVVENRLRLVSVLRAGLDGTDVAIIAVGTPSRPDGSDDTSDAFGVARQIGGLMSDPLVFRSTKQDTCYATPSSNLFQRKTTGAALNSSIPLRMRSFIHITL